MRPPQATRSTHVAQAAQIAQLNAQMASLVAQSQQALDQARAELKAQVSDAIACPDTPFTNRAAKTGQQVTDAAQRQLKKDNEGTNKKSHHDTRTCRSRPGVIGRDVHEGE